MMTRYQYGMARYVQRERTLKEYIEKCDKYLEKARLENDKDATQYYNKMKQYYTYQLKGINKNG